MNNPAPGALINARYAHKTYLLRKKILTLLGAAFHIYGPDGQVLFYCKQKAFKLKEDIRVYTDESMQTEVLVIKARQILDFSAAYDVVDPLTNERVGVLKRKGLASFFVQDEWIIMNGYEQVIGSIMEDSLAMALIRRWILSLIPQSFHGTVQQQRVFNFSQNFNPFVAKLTLDFSPDTQNLLDRRLGIAAAVLLCAIEGKQSSN